ncbi:MAG TPA: UDP-N-acetylmuramoyl-L-alanine--D-glutamate ligase [Candidatus Moranbacteria bacterium]|nr:UDP-N-acetylmuramoyl-L-alanine--D-glutamate ligase [Candidatus Moranbacteria bacterium]
MSKISFKNKKVTVMGIGLHGGAVDMILWLLNEGARVTATDMKSREELAPSLKKMAGIKNLRLVLGQHHLDDFINADLVVKNPSVPWRDKYIQAALAKKIPVEVDASLFFQFCPSKNIIGVTGTKGKTTTSTLIFNILEAAGKKPVAVGIGQGSLMSKLDKIKKDTPVVFELSSWRLSGLRRTELSPKIAVITNIYPDHLNHYSSMSTYVKDKQAIFENQKRNDFLVVNYDQEEDWNFSQVAPSQVVFFSQSKSDQDRIVYLKDKEIYYKSGINEELIIDIDEIRMRGAHNISNVLAAVAAALVFGIDIKPIKQAIKKFKNIPHRLEFIRKIGEVSFYNDTAATTPESAIAAFNSFKRPIYLIAGGANKNLELDGLAKEIVEQELIRKVFLLNGVATGGLKKLIIGHDGENKIAATYDNIETATQEAYEIAKKDGFTEKDGENIGRVVLLSPGCASFGMFANEFDRGEKFKKAVELL